MKLFCFSVLLFLNCLLLPMGVHGSFVPVANPSFEADSLAIGGSTSTINSWTNINGATSAWAPTDSHYSYMYISQGYNVAVIQGGTMYQGLGVSITANTTYTLDVLIGNEMGNGIPLNGYSANLQADTSVINPDSFMRPTPGPGWWVWSRVTCYVPEGSQHVGKELGVRLWSYQGWPTSGRTSFDLVTVQATTTGETPVSYTPYPDPATFDPENPPDWNWHDPSAAAPIPTVSEWGMIVFFILLVGSALWVIRRKTRQESI